MRCSDVRRREPRAMLHRRRRSLLWLLLLGERVVLRSIVRGRRLLLRHRRKVLMAEEVTLVELRGLHLRWRAALNGLHVQLARWADVHSEVLHLVRQQADRLLEVADDRLKVILLR